MRFDQRKIITLAGALVLAGVVVIAGVYGPSAWKVFWDKNTASEQVVIQNPPVDQMAPANQNTLAGQGANDQNIAPANATSVTSTPGVPEQPNVQPQVDVSGAKKYQDPDLSLLSLAPSIRGYFSTEGNSGLSDSAKTLAYQAAWNIHQYVDGYLFGPNAGPQMNEEDIKKYIVFHKALWDKQLKNEPDAAKAAAFTDYLGTLLNKGIDSFDAKDKLRIELFHQEIHDLDTQLFRSDPSSKIYGATLFSTKR
ncbi:MAG: hypothetical protein LBT32_03470 [Peptococcaceae bacterium]|nr:hypothetical protein [Peptococcaceae bacterium]